MNTLTYELLSKYGMLPESIDPIAGAELIASDMKNSLAGEPADMPMFLTYLSCEGQLTEGRSAAVIDMGGTNFRTALVSFGPDGCKVTDYSVARMPGTEKAATWEELISFTADRLEPLMDRTDCIGCCFSYEAEITPEMDGRVILIDKEVRVTGCKDKLLGASISAELAARGFPGKRVIVLNDTVAVLLCGASGVDRSRYSSFIGQVSGTGTNTCCLIPEKLIKKLPQKGDGSMIINMESGSCACLPDSPIDLALDDLVDNAGEKKLEKKTAGVYLGKLTSLLLAAAGTEGILSAETCDKIKDLGNFDTSYVDAWSRGERLDDITADPAERGLISEVSLAVLERSARIMSAVLLAITLYTGSGTTPERPVCDFAEGSLVQKSENYRRTLLSLLKGFESDPGRYIELHIVSDSTLPGSAAAALLNA